MFEFLFQLGGMAGIADNGIFRAELFALRRQLVHLLMPCQREHAEFFGMAGNNVQSAFAYAAGTA